MSFPVFFDTCTLYGEIVNDAILRLAEERFFTPYWSQDVLMELERNLALRVGDTRAARRIHAMTTAFPDATVVGYESLIKNMTCDEKDRHVLAAADHSPAQTLVTFNLKDFPESSTKPLDIEIKHPDEFLLDVFDLDPGRVARVCYTALLSYKDYPQTPEEYAHMLQQSGLPGFAENVYPALDALSE
ncbi:PIN domain-containing protein [Bifidobacterium miconisargentati]|uniref:PIN domain-containing protein n=1 Tax=Bifidobacterium miconisargentati TaxID=2834437 RepID=UPI001BDC7D12|nr:PIN domain-containing protein [Bifidobacterium miconisargentati]MBW3090932.1 PIN domain-containing protein [Bifidobacterium miconisargentati]